MTVLERGKVTVLLIKALSFLEKFCVLVSKCKKDKKKKQNKTKLRQTISILNKDICNCTQKNILPRNEVCIISCCISQGKL